MGIPFGMDINDALIRVNNALSQMTEYPENVNQPRISTSSASENAFAFFRIVLLPGNPGNLKIEDQLNWVEDNIKRRLDNGTHCSAGSGPDKANHRRRTTRSITPRRVADWSHKNQFHNRSRSRQTLAAVRRLPESGDFVEVFGDDVLQEFHCAPVRTAVPGKTLEGSV